MTTFNRSSYRVRAVHCDHRASDEDVYQSLKRATDPLDASWSKLSQAKRIGIKFNQDWPPKEVAMHAGHRQQLVSDTVARATLRLLRERTQAEIFAIDVGVTGGRDTTRLDCTNLLPVLREFDVPFVDGRIDGVRWVDVPGGGLMFDRYPVCEATVDATMVSVQKLKNHAFMGITLCLKNLFGLMPVEPEGRPRGYYHHLVRMPYMLADLGKIYQPALNILDGLVCQAGEEWGKGEFPLICDTLVAGDHVIATDAVGAYLMGHDPQSDWLTEPFHRDRNALLIAAQAGFGTVDLNAIDWNSEVQAPVGKFFSKQTDSRQTNISWRKTIAEQGLYYQAHRDELVKKYVHQYILLQMGEVKYVDPLGRIHASRRQLAGEHPEQGMYLKYVDPEEAEGEHYSVFADTLRETEQYPEGEQR